jgi:carbon-monoxide dehydrogenase medium subunit
MKPAKFEYVAPATVDAAIEALLAANGEGRLLAGGQSLLPLLNFRMTRPAVLVDLNGIKGLSFIEMRDDRVVIGALTRHCEIEQSPLIASRLPVMAAAMRHVAHLAIRNRGTIGGSLSHADPAAELPMLSVFYDAKLSVQGPSGRRTIAAEDFFVGALTNCLEPEEIVVEIEFPILQHDGWAFEEAARRFGDFALASIAVSIRCGRSAIEVDAQTPDRFSRLVTSSVVPNGDLHASAEYRTHLLGQLAKRAMRTVLR